MLLVEQNERIADKFASKRECRTQKPYTLAACPTAFRQILAVDTALVVWQRNLADDISAELASFVLDEVDDILLESEIGALETALADGMEKAGYPDAPALRSDIALLAGEHAAITGDREVKIRLEVVESDACRKFHTDYVRVRTITTYLGQGTQGIEADALDQVGLRSDPEIQQMHAGAVGLFKGRLWQEKPTILHRSPPIRDSGEQRLLLVIDPAHIGDRP